MSLNIKRARTTVAFYPDMAIASEVEAAQKDLDAARAALEEATNASKTLASTKVTAAKKAVEIAEAAYDKIRDAAASTVLDVTLEALSRKRFAEAEENHPPREDDEDDASLRVNIDTFLAEVLPESVVEVKERATGERIAVTADEWREVCDEISDGQYQLLLLTVCGLNRGTARHPF